MVDFSLSRRRSGPLRDTIRQFIAQEVMPLKAPGAAQRAHRAAAVLSRRQCRRELQRRARAGGAGGAIEHPGGVRGHRRSARSCPRSSRWRSRPDVRAVSVRRRGRQDPVRGDDEQREEVPTAGDQGRAGELLRGHRAGRGFRSRHIGSGAPSDGGDLDQRREDLHHPRQRGRLRDGLRGPVAGPGGSRASSSTATWAGNRSRSRPWGSGARRAGLRGRTGPASSVLGEVGNGFELAMQWIGRGAT